jgi:hypothetical protein
MIIHAVELAAQSVLLAFVPTLFFAAGIYIAGRLAGRAERRRIAAIERESRRCREQLRRQETFRRDFHSYNARPTALERWGGTP